MQSNGNKMDTLTRLQERFVPILQRVETHARIVFRHVKCPHRREDAVQEAVALAWKWYVRLTERGKDATRFPTALATFAARAVRSGRKVCGQDKARDALSPLAQQRHSFVVISLPLHSTLSANPFSEALTDNTKSPPDEQAAFRLDFPAWLVSLGDRNRRVAEDMAMGHRTQDLAQLHRITEGRVSQLRREFHNDWLRFQGELVVHPAHPRVGIA
jgi:DNA-directed RNA polymerase specialized sigma24 family protein